MKSYVNREFWEMYWELPASIRRQAKKKYQLFKKNPELRGLQFKRIRKNIPIYSIRINDNYRALGVLENDRIDWFWIGPHDEYDKLLAAL